MTSEYMDRESTRKKFLAPLVVIMLCAVALTGAAYAYSTTVTGNGDIDAKYSIVDIYEKTEGGDYEETSNFDITNDTLNFYTVTDKTGSTLSYKAYIDTENKSNEFVYSTYVRINTDTTATSQTFKLDTFLKYNRPSDCGVISINGSTTVEERTINELVTIYAEDKKTPVAADKVVENTIYYVEITLTITAGDDAQTGIFCNETSMDAVTKKINSFNNTDNELTFRFAATPNTSTNDGQ